MREIETRATSRRSALCNPITLRETERVRLAFVPAVVDNRANPNACIDGTFVYQRKAASGNWVPLPAMSLSTVREGEEFKLTLHAHELLTLLEGLVPLYSLHRVQGVPRGRKKFVEVDSNLAKFISRGGEELSNLLKSDTGDSAELLLKMVSWIATSSGRRNAAEKLSALAPEQIPNFSALLGLAALKETLRYWEQNQEDDTEEFWQKAVSERAYVLSQLFAYPIVVIGSKAYVGGKQVSGHGGKETDFLLSIPSTESLILVEIKTPQTKLLGQEYRTGVYPLSRDLSSAVAQVLRYRQNLMRHFDSVTSESVSRMTLGEPRCIVIAGNSNQLTQPAMRENFELQRERIHYVTIVTYDELFGRLRHLVSLLEKSDT